MKQDELDFSRGRGEASAIACAAKAERVASFDISGAREAALNWLRRQGAMSGEDLVDQLKASGFRGHDDRCFGAVFSVLRREGKIRCVGFVQRRRGNGTAGGRVWEAVA